LFQLGLILVSARYLGTQDFGFYSLALFYGFLFSQLADFGLHLLTTRAVSKQPEATTSVENSALNAKLLLSTILILISAFVSLCYARSWLEGLLFWAIGSSFVVFSLAEFCFSLFRAWGKLKLEAILVLFNRFGILGVGAVTLWLGGGLGGLAIAHLSSAVIVTMVALKWARPPQGWQINKSQISLVQYKQAFPIGLGLLLSMLAFRIDIPLLYALKSEEVVGVYSAAYRLFEPGLLVPAALLAGFFPPIVRAVENYGNKAAIKIALPLLASLFLLGVAGGIFLILLADPLINLLYGTAYNGAAEVLRVLGLVVPVIFVNYGLTHLLIANHREKLNTLFFGIALITNVAANLIFIPMMGGVGAAFATLATEIVLFGLCWFGLIMPEKLKVMESVNR
jgi:O-antigen/teichoic acid export membrane protein